MFQNGCNIFVNQNDRRSDTSGLFDYNIKNNEDINCHGNREMTSPMSKLLSFWSISGRYDVTSCLSTLWSAWVLPCAFV